MALACSDGVIIASDSQTTIETSGQQIRSQVRKLHLLWHNIAYGGSGSVGIMQEAREALQRKFGHPNSFEKAGKQPRKEIADCVSATLKPLFQGRYIANIPGQSFPATSFLFAGYCPEGPLIFELHPDMTTTDHFATVGYAAIGSGEIFPYFAMASLAHFEVRKRSLSEAKLIVYRILDDAIRIAARGLGPPIQMIEIVKPAKANEAGKGRELDDAELKAIGEQVIAGKGLESETLAKLLMPGPKPPEPVETAEGPKIEILKAALPEEEKH
jgi:20S proteasome alpha/beta subunit